MQLDIIDNEIETGSVDARPSKAADNDQRRMGEPYKSVRGEKLFTIGELAREFDVTLRALRFYEDRGLLRPERSGLTRLYPQSERRRLELLLLGKRIGMSIVEIGEILEFLSDSSASSQNLRPAYERFVRQLEHLKARKTEIEGAISELNRHIATLASKIDSDAA